MSFSKAWGKTQPVKANQLKPKKEARQENKIKPESEKEDSLFSRFGEKKEDKK